MEQYMNSPFGIALKRDRLMGQTDEDDLFRNLLEEGTSRKDLKGLPFFILFALTSRSFDCPDARQRTGVDLGG